MEIISNSVLDKLPAHLWQYIKPQKYDYYTAKDQEIWRYVMKRNIDFLRHHAHDSYLGGLKKVGLTTEEIPTMYGMNRILKDIGWAAAYVDGLIPSAAFMEFQAYNVLVITTEIRQLNHIEYTPTPDIIHESAGHGPILANPEYAEFLRRFGSIGAKAISSKLDDRIYQAVRKLAALKEVKDFDHRAIEEAEKEVSDLQAELGELSEMTKVRNLHWWSVEYGLIGNSEDYKLYGAGLLSSIGESKWCLSDNVLKKEYDIHTAYQNFDVTKPQPQLFVTPSFAHLSKVLEELADELAIRHGGLLGVKKLIASEELGTVELSTGLQISGIFTHVIPSLRDASKVAYVQTTGPTTLSYRDKELIGHSVQIHPDGFGFPVGKLKGIHLAIEDMSPRDLEAYLINEGEQMSLEYESGIIIKGKVISGTRNIAGKILLITLDECLVQFQDQILYQPAWGLYHLAIGKQIISAYAGAADLSSFDRETHILSIDEKPIIDYKEAAVYEKIRSLRNTETTDINWSFIWEEIQKIKNSNWLVVLNFYELCLIKNENTYAVLAYDELEMIKQSNPERSHLIQSGISIVQAENGVDIRP